MRKNNKLELVKIRNNIDTIDTKILKLLNPIITEYVDKNSIKYLRERDRYLVMQPSLAYPIVQ